MDGPLGEKPLCAFPVVDRLWASARVHRLNLWVPEYVFSAGRGKSSVEASYNTALEIEEALSSAVDHHVHLFADVVKSFHTVDRGILNLVALRCLLCSGCALDTRWMIP